MVKKNESQFPSIKERNDLINPDDYNPDVSDFYREFEDIDIYDVPDYEIINETFWQRCYSPYLDDFELCAELYNLDNGNFKQKLSMKYYKPERKIDLQKLNDVNNLRKRIKKPKPDDQISINKGIKDFLTLETIEQNNIDINIEDKWFTFKSYVEVVVQNQRNSFKMTDKIISPELKRFIVKNKPDLFNKLIDEYERDFIDPDTGKLMDGFIAAVEPLFKYANKEQIEYILSKNPPSKMFSNDEISKYL